MIRRNKKKEESSMREKAAIQDATNTSGLEQAAVQQKQKNKQEGSNYLFDVEEARNLIETGLKGTKTEIVPVKNEKTGDVQYKKVEYDTRKKKLVNNDGAEIFLDICNSGALNHNTISGNLPGRQIKRKVVGTMGSVYDQIIFNHHVYGIGYKNTPDASNIASIIRNPLIDAMNKARGGRMIESQEKVRVEKESISRDGSKNSEKDEKGLKSLF